MSVLFILFLSICVVQIILVVLYRRPKEMIHKTLLTKPLMKPVKIALILLMIVLYLLFFVKLEAYHRPQPLGTKHQSEV